jgi:hypothetical protein
MDVLSQDIQADYAPQAGAGLASARLDATAGWRRVARVSGRDQEAAG